MDFDDYQEFGKTNPYIAKSIKKQTKKLEKESKKKTKKIIEEKVKELKLQLTC